MPDQTRNLRTASPQMDEERAQQSPVAPNRAALITTAALASGIGSLPYFLFIDNLLWLPAVVFGAAVLAFFSVRKLTSEATTEPRLGEWLLGAWSAIANTSVGSLFGLALFGTFYGGAELFLWAGR